MESTNKLTEGTQCGFKLTTFEQTKIPYNEGGVVLVPLSVMKKIFPSYAKVFKLGGSDWFYAIKCDNGTAVCTQMMDPNGELHPFVIAVVN